MALRSTFLDRRRGADRHVCLIDSEGDVPRRLEARLVEAREGAPGRDRLELADHIGFTSGLQPVHPGLLHMRRGYRCDGKNGGNGSGES